MQSQKRRDLWLLHPNNGRSFTIERRTETANEKKMKGNERAFEKNTQKNTQKKDDTNKSKNKTVLNVIMIG